MFFAYTGKLYSMLHTLLTKIMTKIMTKIVTKTIRTVYQRAAGAMSGILMKICPDRVLAEKTNVLEPCFKKETIVS